MSKRILPFILLGCMSLLTLPSACSLLLDFNECETDGDCLAQGANLICTPENYCVAQDSTTTSNGTATSNGTTATSNGTAECCTNATCAEASATSICTPSCVCMEPVGSTCKVIEGDPTQEGAVIIGSILPTEGDAASIGIPIEQAIQMAAMEINQGGGLGSGRRLVIVACDSSGNTDIGKAAAEHLIALGVPAIVGPAFSGIYIEVSDLLTSQQDVMLLSPSATSPSITNLDDKGLSWRTVPSDIFQGVAIADRVKLLINNAEPALERPRVVAFGKGDAYGNGLLGKVTEELAPTLGNENDFVGTTYPDPGDNPEVDYSGEVTAALDALNGNPADFILLLGTNEIITIMDLVEQEAIARSWPIMPTYVVSDGGQLAETLTYVAENPEVIVRMEGVVPDGKNGEQWDAYNRRFKNQFGATDAGIFSANAYDATYVAAYGIMSLIAQEQDFTGPNLAVSMARLVQGDPINAGPTQLGEARTSLLEGRSIDYDGASGPVQFDLGTGDVSSDVLLWVVEEDPEQAGTYIFVDSLFYAIGTDGRGSWGPLP